MLRSHYENQILAGAVAEIKLAEPNDVELRGELEYFGGELIDTSQSIYIHRNSTDYVLRVTLPTVGNYILRIFAKRPNSNIYQWVLDYNIIRMH